MVGYELHQEYRFTVCGVEMAVSDIYFDGTYDKCAFVEETRKNAQEDCHMVGEIAFLDCPGTDGLWSWVEGGRDLFDTHLGKKVSNAILDYLNANPHPGLPRWQTNHPNVQSITRGMG